MEQIWRMVERVLGLGAMLALFSLVLLPATQVFLRDFFNNPIIGLEEATRWGLIILVFFGAPLLIATNEQIRLAEFIDYLPRCPDLCLSGSFSFAPGYRLPSSLMRAPFHHQEFRHPNLDPRHSLLAVRLADDDRHSAQRRSAICILRCVLRTRRLAGVQSCSDDRLENTRMELGIAVLAVFFVLFAVGFPVVFAILIPSLAYIWWEGIPLATIGQRVLYALNSFPLVAVPVFIFVGNLMNAAGITRSHLSFRQYARGPAAGRARAGEHRWQPDFFRNLRSRACGRRRHRPDRDQGDEG